MTATELSPSARSTIRRKKERARTDRAELHEILDTGLICHVGMQIEGSPRVLPTGYGRIGDTLYLHGSTGARSLREGLAGCELCVTVTHVDGVVYARSLMHHSMNYRSAVVHAHARGVTDPDEKWEALHAIAEQLAPGSWDHARLPTKQELAATAVVAVDLHEASVKVRDEGPADDAEDIARGDAWAGVLPLHTSWGTPEPGEDLNAGFEVPAHVTARKTS